MLTEKEIVSLANITKKASFSYTRANYLKSDVCRLTATGNVTLSSNQIGIFDGFVILGSGASANAFVTMTLMAESYKINSSSSTSVHMKNLLFTTIDATASKLYMWGKYDVYTLE